MRIAVTGCNGRVGKRVVICALIQGHTVVGLDCLPPTNDSTVDLHTNPRFSFRQVDLTNYDETLKALQNIDAVVQLAGFPNPLENEAIVHNTNVVITWNVLSAAAKLGITRIAQASSVNVVPMIFSKRPHFAYFPIDEGHPCEPDEPYGLSKLICELQADTIVRGHPSIRIASLRLHWSVPTRAHAHRDNPNDAKNDLWGYVQEDSGAEAFLLAITAENGKWSGHERFFIAAPETTVEEDSKALAQTHWPDVPLKTEIAGRKGFFDCTKAKELLGWNHDPKGI